MDSILSRCCGLDVHKKSVTACMVTPECREVRIFETMTEDIRSMVNWIKDNGCTHVAMESTGIYWKPIFNLLEKEDIDIFVVNAQHVKNVPGRKTDVKDAEWIAELLKHGLLKGSYIPDRDQRELRELIRYRRSIIDERAREVNRIQKVLEGANIKLSSVASNILGVSGREILDKLVSGEDDPKLLSRLARGRLKSKYRDLERSLYGLIGHHQRMMLSAQLKHIDQLNEIINSLDKEIGGRMRPFDDDLELLQTIPGVGKKTAEHIIAEVGTDMSRFPTDGHLCAWAGMAPGNNESAGKRKNSRTRRGNQRLRSTLVEAAKAASRTKETYLSARYQRLATRRGKNRATVAVGHTILKIAYHILSDKKGYIELGSDYYSKLNEETVKKQAVKRLISLGYKVSIEQKMA